MTKPGWRAIGCRLWCMAWGWRCWRGWQWSAFDATPLPGRYVIAAQRHAGADLSSRRRWRARRCAGRLCGPDGCVVRWDSTPSPSSPSVGRVYAVAEQAGRASSLRRPRQAAPPCSSALPRSCCSSRWRSFDGRKKKNWQRRLDKRWRHRCIAWVTAAAAQHLALPLARRDILHRLNHNALIVGALLAMRLARRDLAGAWRRQGNSFPFPLFLLPGPLPVLPFAPFRDP